MVEESVLAEDLVAAFARLRSHWGGLSGEGREAHLPSPEGDSTRRSESVLFREVAEDLSTVTAAARISEEAVPFVETTLHARLGDFAFEEGQVPEALTEAASSLRVGFETLVRALQQIESGDDILPESARDMRWSATRSVAFFHDLRRLDGSVTGGDGDRRKGVDDVSKPRESREDTISRLTQSYDARRKHIREDTEVPPPAVEAVEFLLRLGAGAD